MSSISEEIHGETINRSLWPEDTVEYRLYPTAEHANELTKLAIECTHFAKLCLRGHLWNYGGFALREIKGEEKALKCTKHFSNLCILQGTECILHTSMEGRVSVTILRMSG